MTRLLNRLLNIHKKGAARSPLQDRLRTYPPYEAPGTGPATALSEAQVRANLAYLLAHRTQRIEALASLVRADADLDLVALLEGPAGPQVDELTHRLFEWAKARWPALPKPRPFPCVWEITQRSHDEGLIYAMLMDVAIVLGECVVRKAPDWRWDVDLLADRQLRELTTSGRVVLMADPVGQATEPYIVDVESAVFSLYKDAGNEALTALNEWQDLVCEAISGAHQAWHRAQARK